MSKKSVVKAYETIVKTLYDKAADEHPNDSVSVDDVIKAVEKTLKLVKLDEDLLAAYLSNSLTIFYMMLRAMEQRNRLPSRCHEQFTEALNKIDKSKLADINVYIEAFKDQLAWKSDEPMFMDVYCAVGWTITSYKAKMKAMKDSKREVECISKTFAIIALGILHELDYLSGAQCSELADALNGGKR